MLHKPTFISVWRMSICSLAIWARRLEMLWYDMLPPLLFPLLSVLLFPMLFPLALSLLLLFFLWSFIILVWLKMLKQKLMLHVMSWLVVSSFWFIYCSCKQIFQFWDQTEVDFYKFYLAYIDFTTLANDILVG